MACRVGITTDPNARMAAWRAQHPDLYNWQILKTHASKSTAQAAEIRIAQANKCVYGVGGDGPEIATWYVYSFNYMAWAGE